MITLNKTSLCHIAAAWYPGIARSKVKYNVKHVVHLFEMSRVGSCGCRVWVVITNVGKFCFCGLENVCRVTEKSGKYQGNLLSSACGNLACDSAQDMNLKPQLVG